MIYSLMKIFIFFLICSQNVSAQIVNFDLSSKEQISYYEKLSSILHNNENDGSFDWSCKFTIAKGIYTTSQWNELNEKQKLDKGLCLFVHKFAKTKPLVDLDYFSATKWVESSTEKIRFEFSYASYLYSLAEDRYISSLCRYLNSEEIIDDSYNDLVILETHKYCSMLIYKR